MRGRTALLVILSIGVVALTGSCASEDHLTSSELEVGDVSPASETTPDSPWSVGSPLAVPPDPDPDAGIGSSRAVAASEVTFSGQYTEISTTGTVTLAWDAPTENADGSGPLDDLTGYTIAYGPAVDDLSTTQDLGNVTSIQLELPHGVYYVGVRAYDTWGNLSDLSNVIQITVGSPS
jgi:hypothetical protein